MRAENWSGPPTPACSTSMSMACGQMAQMEPTSLPVLLPQREYGDCVRRLPPSGPLPVPVRVRQGAEPLGLGSRQSRVQRPVHARLAPRLAGRQGHQQLTGQSAGRWGLGAGAHYALSNPLPVPCFLSRHLTAA